MKNFIKVIDPALANFLAEAGFSYIREGKVLAFEQTEELTEFIKLNFDLNDNFVFENKLRF